MSITLVPDVMEANGKTIRQNNMEQKHVIELGSLVEIDCKYLDEHGMRVFVAEHTRDCDGEPLYLLSGNYNYANDKQELEKFRDTYPDGLRLLLQGQLEGNRIGSFSKDSLKVIRHPEKK